VNLMRAKSVSANFGYQDTCLRFADTL
jgi:hypothetical protein